MDERDERKRTSDDASKRTWTASKPGSPSCSGISVEDTYRVELAKSEQSGANPSKSPRYAIGHLQNPTNPISLIARPYRPGQIEHKVHPYGGPIHDEVVGDRRESLG